MCKLRAAAGEGVWPSPLFRFCLLSESISSIFSLTVPEEAGGAAQDLPYSFFRNIFLSFYVAMNKIDSLHPEKRELAVPFLAISALLMNPLVTSPPLPKIKIFKKLDNFELF